MAPILCRAVAQDEHDYGPLFYPMRFKKVSGLIGHAADIRKGKAFFLIVVIAPDQRHLFRFLPGPFVYDVKAEIKIGRHVAAVVFFKILVGIKFHPRQISIQKH